MRDCIHVLDLAQDHLAAFSYLKQRQTSITVNLSTGRSVSVLQPADTFGRVADVPGP